MPEAREEQEPDSNQQVTSPAKGEGAQEITVHQEEGLDKPRKKNAHNKPEVTTEQYTIAMQSQMEQFL
jgi:hypothetical protein